jgi:hypothetical protein
MGITLKNKFRKISDRFAGDARKKTKKAVGTDMAEMVSHSATRCKSAKERGPLQ